MLGSLSPNLGPNTANSPVSMTVPISEPGTAPCYVSPLSFYVAP